ALLTDTCTGDPIVSGCCATGASRLGNASVRGSGVRHSLFGNLVAWDGWVPLLAVLRNKGPAARGTQVDEPPAYGGWLGLNGSSTPAVQGRASLEEQPPSPGLRPPCPNGRGEI